MPSTQLGANSLSEWGWVGAKGVNISRIRAQVLSWFEPTDQLVFKGLDYGLLSGR